jgi:cell division protein FtsW (lipid II flippase)
VGGLIALLLRGVLPAGVSETNGAKLWVHAGPLSIQPGEFAKIMIIAFVASFLVAKRELFHIAGRRFCGMNLPRARDLAAWAFSVGALTLERELGASLLIFAVVLAIVFGAIARVSWMVVGLAFFLAASVTAYHLYPNVRARVQVWPEPGGYYHGSGYKLSRSRFGLAMGGVGGTGLGAGHPRLAPLANADFIAAAIGEELGLFGLAGVLVLDGRSWLVGKDRVVAS